VNPSPLFPSPRFSRGRLALFGLLLLAGALYVGCSGGGGEERTPQTTATPSEEPGTPRPPDTQAAIRVFQSFVEAVQAGDLDKAWALYAASIEGTTEEHNAAFGCDYGAFSFEFPRMQHLFGRVAPFEVTETYGAAPGSLVIEMRLAGADGSSFLGTTVRVRPTEEYRVQFLNSGDVVKVPGAPDPQPSPDDPTGICGIWTGAR